MSLEARNIPSGDVSWLLRAITGVVGNCSEGGSGGMSRVVGPVDSALFVQVYPSCYYF